LSDPRRTLAEKSFLIKTYILSAALYGGEWIGMNQTRTSLIQHEIDKALFLAIGAPRNCKTICPVRLSWELGVPSVAAACAAARYRIHAKSASMLTDASDILCHQGQGGKKKTWASITRAEAAKAYATVFPKPNEVSANDTANSTKKELVIPSMIIDGLTAQAIAYPKIIPKTWVTAHGNDDCPGKIANEVLAVKAYQWAKEFTQNKLVGPICQMDYEKHEYGLTRNFQKAALRYPHLKDGVLLLVKARLGILPLSQSQYEAHDQANSLSTNAYLLGPTGCPLCKKKRRAGNVMPVEDELAHIFLNCKALKSQRDTHLGEIIKQLRKSKEVRKSGELNQQDMKVTVYLLGGKCSAQGPIAESLDDTLQDMTSRERFMFLWTHGYGNITGIQPDNMGLYGFVPVARFLKSTFGLYQEAMKGIYQSTSDAANTTAGRDATNTLTSGLL
jgi:hypothetical protein